MTANNPEPSRSAPAAANVDPAKRRGIRPKQGRASELTTGESVREFQRMGLLSTMKRFPGSVHGRHPGSTTPNEAIDINGRSVARRRRWEAVSSTWLKSAPVV